MNSLLRNLNDDEFVQLFEAETDVEKHLFDRIVSVCKKNKELFNSIKELENKKSNIEGEHKELKEEIENLGCEIERLKEILIDEGLRARI